MNEPLSLSPLGTTAIILERDFLAKEVARLKRGDFTPEELQNLCHNLHEQKPGCTREEFAAGCRAYQDKIFGGQ